MSSIREGVTDTGDCPRLPIQPLQAIAADRDSDYPLSRLPFRLDRLSQVRLSQAALRRELQQPGPEDEADRADRRHAGNPQSDEPGEATRHQ